MSFSTDLAAGPAKQVFITGATGCVGHYILEWLLQETPHRLTLLVRDPSRLRSAGWDLSRITILQGDLSQIEQFSEALAQVDIAILAAAAWGGNQDVMDINVNRNLQLMQRLDPERCEQVIYFSTESILDQQNQPLAEAGEIGTAYILSKYRCHQRLPELAIYPKISTVFPTLVFGGDKDKPYSFISEGLKDLTKWIGLIRFLSADGSFHFIHAQDIAQVVGYLVLHPSQDGYREYVLGNPPLTADEAVAEVCEYLNMPIWFRVPLPFWLADVIIRVFRFEMAPWDYFCLNYRHFVHKDAVNPATFGMTSACPTLADLFRMHDIPAG